LGFISHYNLSNIVILSVKKGNFVKI